jgi:hypothetical protein
VPWSPSGNYKGEEIRSCGVGIDFLWKAGGTRRGAAINHGSLGISGIPLPTPDALRKLRLTLPLISFRPARLGSKLVCVLTSRPREMIERRQERKS